MRTEFNKAELAAIRRYLDLTDYFDCDAFKISKTGFLMAQRDYDKVPGAHDGYDANKYHIVDYAENVLNYQLNIESFLG